MQIGIVGLGRMGANMARRLLRSKHEVAVYGLKPESVATLAKEGAIGATDFADLAKKLPKPRAVWLMVPAGAPTEETIEHLRPFLESGDTIIDGISKNFANSKANAPATPNTVGRPAWKPPRALWVKGGPAESASHWPANGWPNATTSPALPCLTMTYMPWRVTGA